MVSFWATGLASALAIAAYLGQHPGLQSFTFRLVYNRAGSLKSRRPDIFSKEVVHEEDPVSRGADDRRGLRASCSASSVAAEVGLATATDGWLKSGGNLFNQNYSHLAQINRQSV